MKINGDNSFSESVIWNKQFLATFHPAFFLPSPQLHPGNKKAVSAGSNQDIPMELTQWI